MDSSVEFWNKVKMRLSELNEKQTWLSAQTGIGLQTIRNKVSCNKFPSFPDVLKIVKALGLSMDEFAEYPKLKWDKLEDLPHVIPVYQDLNVAVKSLGYKERRKDKN